VGGNSDDDANTDLHDMESTNDPVSLAIETPVAAEVFNDDLSKLKPIWPSGKSPYGASRPDDASDSYFPYRPTSHATGKFEFPFY